MSCRRRSARADLARGRAGRGRQKVSPLEASMRYLEHLRSAWDYAHPEAPLAQQCVTLTVPASFDPAARELTAEAARRPGSTSGAARGAAGRALQLARPAPATDWRKHVKVGDVILVVDVGGGTTDFSLIAVRERGRRSRSSSASPSAITSCSAATTWTSRSRLLLEERARARAGQTLDAWQFATLYAGRARGQGTSARTARTQPERAGGASRAAARKLVGGTHHARS